MNRITNILKYYNVLKKELAVFLVAAIGLSYQIDAQTLRGNLFGIASIGQNPTLMFGDFGIESTGELYLTSQPTNKLYLIGNYEGVDGSQIFVTINENTNLNGTPINIIGSASGVTKISINLYHDWNGERVDVARAYIGGSNLETFYTDEKIINNHKVIIDYRLEGSDIVWFIEDHSTTEDCLDLIVQKKNHTLECNNNAPTNGGYKFSYYKWYQNNELIHEGANGEGKGGYYYTGKNKKLDPNSDYYVIATDQYGKDHISCIYNPILNSIYDDITIYPNPCNINNPVVILEFQTEDDELLEKGIITVYNMEGKLLGIYKTNGHKYTSIQLPSISGIYIVKLSSGDFIKTSKVMVQNKY